MSIGLSLGLLLLLILRSPTIIRFLPSLHSLSKFEVIGGLVPGTEESRGKISLSRPNRQWDFPFAWPPHQIMAWVGLERYGFIEEASRLAYRWVYLMTVAFVDFNGVVPEKVGGVSCGEERGSEARLIIYSPSVRCRQALSHGRRRVWKPGDRLQVWAQGGLRVDQVRFPPQQALPASSDSLILPLAALPSKSASRSLRTTPLLSLVPLPRRHH